MKKVKGSTEDVALESSIIKTSHKKHVQIQTLYVFFSGKSMLPFLRNESSVLLYFRRSEKR